MRLAIVLAVALVTPALAGDAVQFGPAQCVVTGRPEMRKTKSGKGTLVVCRVPMEDVTGDGIPEIAETVLVLRRNGELDCGRSSVVVNDSTLLHQAISIADACDD